MAETKTVPVEPLFAKSEENEQCGWYSEALNKTYKLQRETQGDGTIHILILDREKLAEAMGLSHERLSELEDRTKEFNNSYEQVASKAENLSRAVGVSTTVLAIGSVNLLAIAWEASKLSGALAALILFWGAAGLFGAYSLFRVEKYPYP